MKKILIISAIIAFVFPSCNNKNTNGHVHDENCAHNHQEETSHHHEHDEDCDHDHHHEIPAQESFTIEPDSIN